MRLGAWLVPSGISQGAAVAPATTQFHWQNPSLSTECSRCEKPSACFSVLGVAGSSPGRTSYPNFANGPPFVSVCALVGSIASGHPKKKELAFIPFNCKMVAPAKKKYIITMFFFLVFFNQIPVPDGCMEKLSTYRGRKVQTIWRRTHLFLMQSLFCILLSPSRLYKPMFLRLMDPIKYPTGPFEIKVTLPKNI